MNLLAEACVLLACALVCGVGGFVTGLAVGVKETEERWSAAVAIADEHRRQAARSETETK